ncbi:MAG: hypothetical protein AAF696_32300, partial [Bacteroidota bacterium]
MSKQYVLISLFILFPFFGKSQVTKLLDPNADPTTQSSDLKELTVFQNELYAYAESGDQKGLWKLDSTQNKMELIFSGLEIFSMAANDNLIFMIANSLDLGTRIWLSDGSQTGTRVFDGFPLGRYFELEVKGDLAYLVVSTPSSTYNLYSTDGSLAQTHFLSKLQWSSNFNLVEDLASVGDKLLFFGINPQDQIAVYETDGSPQGTIERFTRSDWTRFNPPPRKMTSADSLGYFVYREGTDVFLWQVRKDTVLKFAEVPTAIYDRRTTPSRIYAFQNHHFFYGGRAELFPVDDLHILRTDGSLGQIDTVHTFQNTGAPLATFALPQALLFTVQGVNFKPEIWIYGQNGLINTPINLPYFQSEGREVGVLDSTILFEIAPFEVWKSDGSLAGTAYFSNNNIYRNFNLIPESQSYKGNLYLASSSLSTDRELHVYDGNSISLFEDINPYPTTARIRHMNLLNDKLIFSAYDDSTGQELYVSDGNVAGSGLVKDLLIDTVYVPGLPNSSEPQDFAQIGNELFFSAKDSSFFSSYLYKTDGSSSGTQRVSNVWTSNTGGAPFNSNDKIFWKNKLYFSGSEPVVALNPNSELYQYDPSTNTSILFKEIEPTPALQANPRYFHVANDFLFFVADTRDEGEELWISDGSEAGTSLFMDIAPGQRGAFRLQNFGFLPSFAGLDSLLIFTADDGTNGVQLWRTNASPSGTFALQDSMTFRSIGDMHVFKDQAIFVEFDVISGAEIWITDGSESGTKRLLSPNLTSFSQNPDILYADEDLCFFSLRTGDTGIELWRTDGTVAGTFLLKDIYPGPASSLPTDI